MTDAIQIPAILFRPVVTRDSDRIENSVNLSLKGAFQIPLAAGQFLA